MGVHGLWKLLEPSGQMVPLEALAGKVLAVDVSIWLHQAIKGMHDMHGAPVGAAHLIILFHRLCKLLFYRIKPVFVFDGGVPALKHQTLAARRRQTNAAKSEALKVREKLIKNLLKHEAVRQVLSNETASAALGLNSFALPGPSVEEDLYKLPPIAANYADTSSSDELKSDTEGDDENRYENIHSIDVTSKEFNSLPPDVRHDILTELIETRKQSSWKSLDLMPKNSDEFSDFQMSRLLKRNAVQTCLEKTGKEMGGRALSLQELEYILNGGEISSLGADVPSKRIAQDNVTRYMLIQRNQSGNPEEVISETKNEKFDIMKHLEDVDWFSESDPEILDEKLAKEQDNVNKLNSEKVVIKKEPEERSSISEPSLLISKRPKVQMTKEIVDILTILEEEDVESDVKVKLLDIKNRFDFSEDSIKKELEDKEVEKSSKNETIGFKEIFEEVNRTDTEKIVEKKILTTSANEIVSETEMEYKSTEQDIKIKENEKNDNSFVSIDKIKVEYKDKASASSSSSDSESDFIPITMTDIETETRGDENEKALASLQEVSRKENDGSSQTLFAEDIPPKITESDTSFRSAILLNEAGSCPKPKKEDNQHSEAFSIIISPNKISESDNIFDDVFPADKPKTSDSEQDVEDDTVQNLSEVKESIERYKLEFQKEVPAGDLNEFKLSLEKQQREMLSEKGKQERLALNPTDQMYLDAQELLRLFGVPFIVAPMEAEAQCAVLDTLGLTEGTITDDSDIWLFGGRVVYKNFFNQNKHVLEYTSVNIQKGFKLKREDLIRMAMLVGSDYTLGLNGIGPVTALEILASFPSHNLFDGLEKFRDWFTGRCKTGLPRISLKKKIRNTVISPGFPNKAVGEAYLHPQVDDSDEAFSWAKPNVELIRKYVKVKMGWSSDKCNNLLFPVLKKLEENASQRVMEKYFKTVSQPVGFLSKRVENAIKRLGGDEFEDDQVSKKKETNKRTKRTRGPAKKAEKSEGVEEPVKKQKSDESCYFSGSPTQASVHASKELFINEKLHREEKIPQKEKAQKLSEERKKQAIEIFRTFKGKGKKRTKVFAKKEANLSESSSESN